MAKVTKQRFEELFKEIHEKDREFLDSTWKDRKAGAEEYYPYIPAYFSGHKWWDLFNEMEKEVFQVKTRLSWERKSRKDIVFLDVGAGTGKIVKAAKIFGFKAYGVEVVKSNAYAGRKMFKLSAKELILKDAFKLSPEFMGKVDILYSYMPIRVPSKMSSLHIQLMAQIETGRRLFKKYNPVLCMEAMPKYYPLHYLQRSRIFENNSTEDYFLGFLSNYSS